MKVTFSFIIVFVTCKCLGVILICVTIQEYTYNVEQKSGMFNVDLFLQYLNNYLVYSTAHIFLF